MAELSATSLGADDPSLDALISDPLVGVSGVTFESLATELFATSEDSLVAALSDAVADKFASP